MNTRWRQAACFFGRRLLVAILTFLGAQAIITMLRNLIAAGWLGPQEPFDLPEGLDVARSAGEIIAENLPVTLSWLLGGMGVAIVLATVVILLGVVTMRLGRLTPAVGTLARRAGQLLLSAWVAVPVFVMALIVALPFFQRIVALGPGHVNETFLPWARVIALAILPAGLVARAVLGEIAHAEQSGASEDRYRVTHYVLNVPIFTLDMMGGWLSGMLLVSFVLGSAGNLGGPFMDAVVLRNWPIVWDAVSIFVSLTVGAKLLADLLRTINYLIFGRRESLEDSAVSATSHDETRAGIAFWLPICAVLLVASVLVVALVPVVAPSDSLIMDFRTTMAPIGAPGHPLGTDRIGRDILSRLLFWVEDRSATTSGCCTTGSTARRGPGDMGRPISPPTVVAREGSGRLGHAACNDRRCLPGPGRGDAMHGVEW
jgi:hypothetical protein